MSDWDDLAGEVAETFAYYAAELEHELFSLYTDRYYNKLASEREKWAMSHVPAPKYGSCAHCQKPWEKEQVSGRAKKYCSRKCLVGARIKPKQHTCQACSVKFMAHDARMKVCSEKCRNKIKNARKSRKAA